MKVHGTKADLSKVNAGREKGGDLGTGGSPAAEAGLARARRGTGRGGRLGEVVDKSSMR